MRRIFWLLLCCSTSLSAQTTSKLSMLFTGDIMQHQVQIETAFNSKKGRYDYQPCFKFIKPVLSSPDLTIGNLEVTLAGPPFTGYPIFSSPDELLETLKDSGFDVLVTANNHALDRGKKGLERTIDKLDSVKMQHTGTFKDTLDWLNNYPLIVEAKGFRISLLNYTYGANGLKVKAPNKLNLIDTLQIRKDLQKAKDQHTDLILVFMHWGNQYENTANREQRQLAEFCFRNGARIIIGSHPHVLQSIEWRKDKDQVVAYSLGNFVANQPERYRGIGAMLHIDLEKSIQANGSSIVKVNDVAYSLSWVYRTQPDGNFFILPVDQFENDTDFVTNPASRDRLKLLVDDTKKLFERENKNVRKKNP